MKLTTRQRKQIENALLDGFDMAGLERMLRLEMDVFLEQVAGGSNLTETVHALVDWAERADTVPDLIAAARRANPNNVALTTLFNESAMWAERAPQQESLPASRPLRRRLWPVLGLTVLVAILVVVAATTGLIAWQTQQALCGDSPLCVLVAEFSSRDEQAGRDLAEEIRAELIEELGGGLADEAVIRVANRVEDAQSAQALAAQEDALLVIWGSIKELDGNRVRVRFELTDLLGVGESTGLPPFRAEPVNYDEVSGQVECTDCFDVSLGELGQRIDIVAHAAAGFLHYAERPEQAYHEFLKAMHCAGETIDPDLLDLLSPQCEVTAQPDGWDPGLLTYYAGKSAVQSGDYAAGIDLLARAARQNPADPAAPIGIASAYQGWIGQGEAPEVVAALAEAERRIETLSAQVVDPSDLAALRYDLGLVFELAGDWESAAAQYGDAARRFGENPSAYVSLIRQGHAQRQAGDPRGAESTLRHASHLVPDAPWAYLEMARLAWYDNDDPAAAQARLDQAARAAPEAMGIHMARAELCRARADYVCAEEAYDAALTLGSDSGLLHVRVGDFYRPTDPVLDHQSWARAAQQYTWAEDFRGADPWLHERLGYVAYNIGQVDDAVKHYEEAVRLSYGGASQRLTCALARSYEAAGRPEAAQPLQEQCEPN